MGSNEEKKIGENNTKTWEKEITGMRRNEGKKRINQRVSEGRKLRIICRVVLALARYIPKFNSREKEKECTVLNKDAQHFIFLANQHSID